MAQDQKPQRPAIPSLKSLSRRTLLRGAGLAVGASVMPSVASFARAGQEENVPRTLSESEYAILDAACRRLIPSDDNGPGAGEAQAARYIDRALAGGLTSARNEYGQGLAALDRYARASRGASFATLDESDQDGVLTDVQDGTAPGLPAGFFNTLRSHTIQGTFSDPFYGGNAGFVGWDMIGYPGVRVAVDAEYQQIGGAHPPNHVSVYDSPMFEEGEE